MHWHIKSAEELKQWVVGLLAPNRHGELPIESAVLAKFRKSKTAKPDVDVVKTAVVDAVTAAVANDDWVEDAKTRYPTETIQFLANQAYWLTIQQYRKQRLPRFNFGAEWQINDGEILELPPEDDRKTLGLSFAPLVNFSDVELSDGSTLSDVDETAGIPIGNRLTDEDEVDQMQAIATTIRKQVVEEVINQERRTRPTIERDLRTLRYLCDDERFTNLQPLDVHSRTSPENISRCTGCTVRQAVDSLGRVRECLYRAELIAANPTLFGRRRIHWEMLGRNRNKR